jgi:protein arginine kinase
MGADGPIIATRARLARNDRNHPFPHRLSTDQARRWCHKTSQAIVTTLGWPHILQLNSRPTDDQQANLGCLIERHLASPTLRDGRRMRAVAYNTEHDQAIMLLEEDHLRLQAYHAGLNAAHVHEHLYASASQLRTKIPFAADAQFGYLTACPTNAGTGLRFSALVHLPALIAGGLNQQLQAACRGLRLLVRGIHGEGSQPLGRVVQISNAGCFGLDEEQLQHNFAAAVAAVQEFELQAREQWRQREASLLTDLGAEALDVLTSGQPLPTDTALAALSRWRLAGELDLLPWSLEKWAQAWLRAQPHHAKQHWNARDPQPASLDVGATEHQIQLARQGFAVAEVFRD